MITRRDLATPAGLGAVTLLAGPLGAQPGHARSEVTSLAMAFYSAANSGQWGTVTNLLSDNVELRTNSGYFVETDSATCAGEKSCFSVGYENIPPVLVGADDVVGFLQKRQKERNWRWEFARDHMISPRSDFLISYSSPWSNSNTCNDPLCAYPPDFVHCFWADVKREGGVAVSSQIGAIYETELMKLGSVNG